jgi:hypothetical protein
MTAIPDAVDGFRSPSIRPDPLTVCVTEELLPEFGALFSRAVITGVVHAARESLRGQVSEAALPEFLARLARTRLTTLRLELLG